LTKTKGLPLLRQLIGKVQLELFAPLPMPSPGLMRRRVTQKGVAPEIRTRVVTKLIEAIDEAEHLGKGSGRRSGSGGGGISPKERWYLVMG